MSGASFQLRYAPRQPVEARFIATWECALCEGEFVPPSPSSVTDHCPLCLSKLKGKHAVQREEP